MSDNQQYMADFFQVFENIGRQGPGSDESTRRAFSALPEGFKPRSILEMGCGSAPTSLLLAEMSGAQVVALDNHQPFLDKLLREAVRRGLAPRVAVQCASMAEPPFQDESFDLIWAEGSAYIMGFANALQNWRGLLKPGGCLALSEAVWLTQYPPQELLDYWQREYPDMRPVETRLAQAREMSYQVLDWFTLPLEDWDAFYGEVAQSLAKTVQERGQTQALRDIAAEVDIFTQYRGLFGYAFFILQKV